MMMAMNSIGEFMASKLVTKHYLEAYHVVQSDELEGFVVHKVDPVARDVACLESRAEARIAILARCEVICGIRTLQV